MNTTNNTTKLQRAWWIIGLIIIVVAAFFLIRSSDSEAELVIAPTGGTPSVYIDRTQRDALSSSSSDSTYGVTAGTHQVIVSRDGYWPWSDDVSTTAGEQTKISPFLIQETPQEVLQAASSVQTALQEAASQPVAASSSAATSSDGKMRAYVAGESNLIAQWNAGEDSAPDYLNCHEGTCGVSVYNRTPITQIAFYPERHDVLFFATANGVYAIEIDPRGATQNFQPVVQNVQNPVFSIEDDQIFVQSTSGITVSNI